jgi:protein-S-isoprenylcysteine O-methyltransferase Ste14
MSDPEPMPQPRALPRFVIPPAVFLAAALLMAGLDALAPRPELVPADWRWLALIPLAMGAVLGGWAIVLFVRAGTPPEPWKHPQAFVAHGPYRISRNPMYLGLALWLAAFALHLGSALPWLVPPFFIYAMTRLFISREEALLEATFGDPYRRYRARVRRWV